MNSKFSGIFRRRDNNILYTITGTHPFHLATGDEKVRMVYVYPLKWYPGCLGEGYSVDRFEYCFQKVTKIEEALYGN